MGVRFLLGVKVVAKIWGTFARATDFVGAVDKRIQIENPMRAFLVDIVRQTVGDFQIGATFELPSEIRDRNGEPILAGDALAFEPYHPDVSIVLGIYEEGGTLVGRVIEAVVHSTAPALVCGRLMSEVDLQIVLSQLASVGIKPWRAEDTLLHLTNGATLGVFGKRLEMIWLGSTPQRGTQKWKEVTAAELVNTLIAIAARIR